MKVWTNTEFTGHWPVGTAAVVVADTPNQACEALNAQLRSIGLPGNARSEDFRLIVTSKPNVTILRDGDY